MAAAALSLFERARAVVDQFTSPRAWAFALLGLAAYLERFGQDCEVRRLREHLALRLAGRFRANGSADWPWPEDVLTYENARLPQALLVAGRAMGRDDLVESGLASLAWLLRAQTAPDGYLSLIGNTGWWRRGGSRASSDQQPVDAQALVQASGEAFALTGEVRWQDAASRCLGWFLGQNDLRLPLYDYTTGGCRDGLHPDRPNENQGAESTLAWLGALLTMHRLRDRGVLGAVGVPPETEAAERVARVAGARTRPEGIGGCSPGTPRTRS
jgi:hypothetical protein